MRRLILFSVLVVTIAGCGSAALESAAADQTASEVIALERAALDRWIKPDPDGYIELAAPEITYFDPTTEKRVDGRPAMQERLAPLRNVKLPFTDPRYDMIDPKVQHYGDVALLTFNLVNYGTVAGAEKVLARWNSTEVYGRVGGRWKIVHSHWSLVQPEIKQPAF
ncbi:MAG: YybH family protein [Gemmatimonadaceae bacterium]